MTEIEFEKNCNRKNYQKKFKKKMKEKIPKRNLKFDEKKN